MSGIVERATVFACQQARLVGIVSVPAGPAQDTGVVIIVGGPQYRAGSHRQFVLLARALAAAGHPTLRFDYRGMGDSGGALRSFEAVDDDVAAAIDALLREQPTLRRVVLWGLCDGASAALMYWQATGDARVAGLCLANPWVRSQASHARAQVKHYYTQRLLERDFWIRLLSGKVATSALSGLLRSVMTALRPASPGPAGRGDQRPYQARMADAWRRFPGPMLLVISGQDLTAKEFLDTARGDAAWQGTLDRPGLTRHELPQADHTFSDPAASREVEALTCAWLAGAGRR
ncbi:MAG: hydrolase 1, exosortase A system-associated [Burkholderiales bacterium]|nr:hydrolase 1, exosortase A system-associated [Burkholderiales bacterium]